MLRLWVCLQRPEVRLLTTLALVLAVCSLGWADDCSSPEDTMDTLWIGPPIKALISAVIVVAVNGETILTQVLQAAGDGGASGEEGEEAPDPPLFRLNVNTEGRRTTLQVGSDQGLWVYASIQVVNPPPDLDLAGMVAEIGFSGEPALQLSGAQIQRARKAVYVKAVSPADGSAPEKATLTVSAVLAGRPVTAPVNFTLSGGYELVVETHSEWQDGE